MTIHAKNFLRPALATALLLSIPLVAMQFTTEVIWTLSDFTVAGGLILCTGLAAEVILRKGVNTTYRLASGLALAATFFLIWVNLAVGLIASGPNLPNLLFGAIPAVGLIGAVLAGLRPPGMARTMFTMSAAVALISVAASAVRKPAVDSDFLQVLGVPLVFAGLFAVSALLFRRAAARAACTVATAP